MTSPVRTVVQPSADETGSGACTKSGGGAVSSIPSDESGIWNAIAQYGHWPQRAAAACGARRGCRQSGQASVNRINLIQTSEVSETSEVLLALALDDVYSHLRLVNDGVSLEVGGDAHD